MNDIRDILADNLTYLMGKSMDKKSQNALAKSSKKLGDKGKVGQTTIGNVIRSKDDKSLPFPKLDTLDSLAKLFDITVADLLTENLNRGQRSESKAAIPATQSGAANLSKTGQMLLDRLEKIESAGHTPSALYALIENALDLVQPIAGGNDYAGLNDL